MVVSTYFVLCLLIPGLGGQLTARLVHGTYWAGRLEIFYQGKWSTVCGDDFGQEEAQVACRMLGRSSSAAVAVSSSMYGAGSGTIVLDNLVCQGTETSFTQCRHNGFYTRNCRYSANVVVACVQDANHLRLVGSGRVSHATGRVQILLGTDWTTPCVRYFSNSAAKVLCRQLNLPTTTATMVAASTFGPGQGSFLNVSFLCTGREPSILDCFQNIHGFTQTCSANEVGVICSNSTSAPYIVLDSSTSTNYPLLEGTSVKLRCMNRQQGQSGVTYTWPETAGGLPSGEYLVLDNVTRAHHGGRVKCMTRLFFTSDTLEIQVYYRPSITITWDATACENLDIQPNLYVVRQNQNVTFWCNADSNPRPASTVWSGKMSANTGRLQITAADNAKHTGQYTCTVTTETVPGDSRLPLTSSHTFYIAVTYASRVVRFHLNYQSDIAVTVAENANVRMLCEANGRPTPHMVLVSGPDNNRHLATRLRGDVSLAEQPGALSYVMNQAACDATGDYRCEVDNGIGRDSRRIRLVVLCPPRKKDISETLPSLDLHSNKDQLIFEMTSYPTPYVKDIRYIGPVFTEDIEGTPAENKLQVDCVSSSFAPALISCNITAVNMTRDDEGYYKIVFSNSLGHLPFAFRVCSNDHESTKTSVFIIIGAAVPGVVVVAVVVALLVRWFRGKTTLHSQTDTNRSQVPETRLSLQDIRPSGVPNVYHAQNEESCQAASAPCNEERNCADELYVNAAELEQGSEDSEHEYSCADDLWK